MKSFKYMALAALVAFAACDEGTDVVVPVVVTGQVTGTVTIEGASVSGVKVDLSSGATTTTNGSGAFAFADVAAGAYTITISGFAADATFSSTSKAATIVTTGQVATVNFDGAYVRTSAILGSVAAGGAALSGVKVSITGATPVTTDANGQYAFSGLRAGSYTVTISDFDAARYAFATATQTVTLGVGESKVASFSGQFLATATVSGTLYIDGNGNKAMDSGEPAVAKAGIQIALERAIGDSLYTTTDATGKYAFANLEEGNYKVILLPQAAIPGAFTQTSDERYVVSANAGSATTQNFAFAVTTQYVTVYGMLGTDGKKAGVAPIKDWSITLYPTQLDAAASTFPITTLSNKTALKTDANGKTVFSFLRKNDYSPNANVVDGIVFARVAGAPTADYAMNGETVIEIPWMSMDSMVMSPDTFDALYGRLILKVRSDEIDNDTLPGWTFEMRSDKDSVGGGSNNWTDFTNTKGDLAFDIDLAKLASIRGGMAVTFPDTLWFKLAGFQIGANGLTFKQIPEGNTGTAAGSYLRFIWDGTTPAGDTIVLGRETVQYTQSRLLFRVHREQDDSLGYSSGDGFIDAELINAQVYKVNTNGTKTSVVGPWAAEVGSGLWTTPPLDVPNQYEVRARSTHGGYVVLSDTAHSQLVTGKDQNHYLNQLRGSMDLASAFMYKSKTNNFSGVVKSRDGATGAPGLVVTIAPTGGNIQGTPSFSDTTIAGGAYSFANLREGPYTVTVAAGDSAYSFLRTLKKNGTTWKKGYSVMLNGNTTADNTSPTAATLDLQGFGVTAIANFEGLRNDVTFSGVVVNDRDSDLNVIDPGEALPGAVINLYRDDDDMATPAARAADSLVATATTDANGAYSFTGLVEGRYTAKWNGTPSDAIVLTSLVGAGTTWTPADTIVGIPVFGNSISNTGTQLPSWGYKTSVAPPAGMTEANFTFLFKNTEVKGTVKDAAAAGVATMTITARRCLTATTTALTAYSGPVTASITEFCTGWIGAPMNVVTDASGAFSFAGLPEGIYEITPQIASAGKVTIDRATVLYWTHGSGDIESAAFVTN